MFALVLAASATAGELSLSYDQCLERAAEKATGVRAARADVISASGAYLSSRATFEPMLSLGGNYFSTIGEGQFQFGEYTSETTGLSLSANATQALATGTTVALGFTANQTDTKFLVTELDQEFGTPAWDSKLALTVSQALLQGHKMAFNLAGMRSAESTQALAEVAANAARQQAIADAAAGYWRLRYQRRMVEIAEQSRFATEEQARIVTALVEAGRLAPVESTRTQAALAQAERAKLEAVAAEQAAEDALATLVGEPLSGSINLVSSPPMPTELGLDEESVVSAVVQGNPQLRIARAKSEQAKIALGNARHALLPELGASAGVGVRGYETSFSSSLDEMAAAKLPEWNVGANLSLPLLNRADRGAAGTAAGRLARAEADLAAASATVEQAARAQVRVLVSARRTVELSDLNVRLAEETLLAEGARLTEGRSLQKDLIAAQRELDQARADAEKARTDWLIALVELERLKGSL